MRFEVSNLVFRRQKTLIGFAMALYRVRTAILAALLSLGVAACSSDVEYDYPVSAPGGGVGKTTDTNSSLFGDGGLLLFGSKDTGEGPSGGAPGVGVNSFLWRATLDTVSFMPLASADPFGGVIISDWYQPPESPTERFKVNVYILGTDLRADGLRATIFRQRLHPSGTWIDSAVEANTGIELEDAILTRARELRVASAATTQ